MRTSPFLLELLLEQLGSYGLDLYRAGDVAVFPLYGVSGALLNASLLIIVPKDRNRPLLALPIKFWDKPLPDIIAIKYAAFHFPELASAVGPDCSFPEPITEEELLKKATAEHGARS